MREWVMPEKSSAQAFADAYRLPSAEALAYMQRRDKLTKTYDWRDLWQDEHANQFTVSRLARVDLLESIRDRITRSVDGDLSRRDFMREGQALLADAGWWGEKTVIDPATGDAVTTTFDPARLKLIFDVNTRMAYSAGQWERVQRNVRTHPYIRYITKGDERVRASHAVWNNLVLPVDDPVWQTRWPPNGWRCRCRVVAISQRDYDKGTAPDGSPFNKTPPDDQTREWVNKRTGEVMDVPVGVDPGFDYNPGVSAARKQGLQKIVADKLAAVPAELAQAARKAGLFQPVSVADFAEAGRKIVSELPDGVAMPLACRGALLARLSEEVGISTPVQVASKGAGAKLVQDASKLFPDTWTEAADAFGPLYVKARAGVRGWHYTETRNLPGSKLRLNDFGTVAAEQGAGYMVVRSGALDNAVHEFSHRLQSALPALDGLFQDLHRQRTTGEELEQLRHITNYSYTPDEVTRKDKYVNPYQGKEYGQRGALEVMTMALEAVLGGGTTGAARQFREVYTNDRAMFDFVVGLLFHWKP
jgi:SPP1 gp7 family putative phage head morphogenesis protein